MTYINDGGLGLLDTDRLNGILTGDLGDLDLDLDLDLLFLLGDLESELDLRGDFDRDLCLDLGGVLENEELKYQATTSAYSKTII